MDTTDSCLDAETLAAWADGGLTDFERERARTHVADCARCQALVGTLARIDAAVPASVVEPAFKWARATWLPWLVPLTAAVVAVAVWVAIPRSALDQRLAVSRAPAIQLPAATTKDKDKELSAQAEPAAAKSQEAAAPQGAATPTRLREDAPTELRRDAPSPSEMDSMKKQEALSSTITAADATAPPAAAPAPTAALGQLKAGSAGSANTAESAQSAFRRETSAPVEIMSPDPNLRWRIAGAVVQRSTNGGAAWENTPTGVPAELVAGAAPAPLVCWLVGRAGTVLLSTDGRSWRRVPFPEITDLSAVRARDARGASVTTADGRTLSTTDAGTTWVPGPLQGF